MRGCGKTYPVVLIERMRRYIVSCRTMWSFLLLLLAGNSIKDAWETTTKAFTTDTGYKLHTTFAKSQVYIRKLLYKLDTPEASNNIADPLLQTIQRVKTAFRASPCPISAFQLRFQKPFFR